MVHEPVDGRHRHGRVGEDLAPLAEGLVAGDDQRAALVALGDELEQHAGLGLILPHVAQIVEDQAIEAVELGQQARKREVAAGCLQSLDEVGGAGEQGIRACVTKRKISGGTMSEAGRTARDVMLGLMKTCAKLGVSFFRYLGDRLGIPDGATVPPLPDLVRNATTA